MMYDKVITIFGGSGFLGRVLVQKLAKLGARLNVVVRDPRSSKFLTVSGEVGQVALLAFPRCDDAYEKIVKGSSVVINLVGRIFETRRESFEQAHVTIAQNIARAVARQGISQLIHVSAIGASPKARSAYARTKAQGEHAVLKAFPDTQIIRPSVMFGPYDQFLNRFATLACISPVLMVFGGGTTKMQPVYVGDVADAIVALVQGKGSRGHVYELGGPDVLVFRDLLGQMLRYLKRYKPILSVPFQIGRIMAFFAELLPAPLITRDQLRMLQEDNVVAKDSKSFSQLGIIPHTLDDVLPMYLGQYRSAF